jgi:hypothetical protein
MKMETHLRLFGAVFPIDLGSQTHVHHRSELTMGASSRFALLAFALVLPAACGDEPRSDDPSQHVVDAARDAGDDRDVTGPRGADREPDPRAVTEPDGGDAGDAGAAGSPDSVLPGAGGSSEPVEPDAPSRAVSEYCGDALRDPVLEPCDDGPGSGDDACSADCRVRTLPLLASDEDSDGGVAFELERSLGTSPHVAMGLETGFGVVYVERQQAASVWLQTHDQHGGRLGLPIEVSAGLAPADAANPAVAALPDLRYAVAFTDGSSGTPDVVARLIDAASGRLAAVRAVHDSSAGFQQDADLLWTGKELIVAWTDLLDVRYRAFSADLEPRGPARFLAADSAAIESSVTLARFGAGWAAAYRANEDGFERVEVIAGSLSWRTAPAPPGPSGDRPALVELDAEHLLLLFTVGTDPLGGGSANVGRMRAALLSAASPGEVAAFDFVPLREPYASDVTLPQRRPSAARVGDRTYAAWESATPAGGTAVFIAQLGFDRDSEILLQHEELAQPLAGVGEAAERNPRIGVSQLFPEGALITLWEHALPRISEPRIMLDYRPSPFVAEPSAALPARPLVL